MDDWNEKLNRLLSDPETVGKMQAMLSSMGATGEAPSPPAPAPVVADNDTALLKALRPYIHGEREKRLDDAIKLMELSRLLPLLLS